MKNPGKTPMGRRGKPANVTSDSLNLIAYRQLREQIITLKLQPGAALSESMLTRRLQRGRAAVRFAVQHLRTDRLIQVAPRSGTSVTELNVSELSQAYQVRTSLEILAARLCAHRLTRDDIIGLNATLHEARKAQKAGRAAAMVEFVHAFYAAMRAASHNEILDSLSRIAAGLTERFEYYCALELARPIGDLEPEERLLKAIDSRDAEAAEAAMVPIGGRRADTVLSLVGMTL